ncbi:MAG: flagellar basal body protein [Planctomycetota bacterium]
MVTSALQIGRSALETYQSALQAVGNNIANAGNPDYTRQSVGLAAVHGSPLAPGLQPGAGVTMHELKRHLDEQLENRVRAGIAEYDRPGHLQQAHRVLQQSLGRTERPSRFGYPRRGPGQRCRISRRAGSGTRAAQGGRR